MIDMKKSKINYLALLAWLVGMFLIFSNLFFENTYWVFSLLLSLYLIGINIIGDEDYTGLFSKSKNFFKLERVLIFGISSFILINRFFNILPDLRFIMTFQDSMINALLIFLSCKFLPEIVFYSMRTLLFDKVEVYPNYSFKETQDDLK
jgi:hypothetical protein